MTSTTAHSCTRADDVARRSVDCYGGVLTDVTYVGTAAEEKICELIFDCSILYKFRGGRFDLCERRRMPALRCKLQL